MKRLMNSKQGVPASGGTNGGEINLKAEVERLQATMTEKDAAISALQGELQKMSNELQNTSGIVRRHHPLTVVSYTVEEAGLIRSRIGRNASVATSNVLGKMQPAALDQLASRVIVMFRNPLESVDYLQSHRFAEDLMQLAAKCSGIFEEEPRCLFLQSPVYVFGDIHGNLEDLNFFSENIWKLGMQLTAGKFLFLGDYVDRGLSSLECVGYLMALKLQNPGKIFMLRGNHETRDVNGWEEHYQDRSFLWQCKDRFGVDMGERVWEAINQMFDRLPLTSVIDHDIFCVHGGIPRPVPGYSRLQAILCVPVIAGVNPPNEYETAETHQVASDCLWSDPATDDQEEELDEDGFGESLRGGGAICFGKPAIEAFLHETNLSYIVRAHEAHAEGVALSKNAKVFTVFSTSKDHGQGASAMAGCILVDADEIQVINRSPRYKNRYVHKRNSMSLAGLSRDKIEQRAKVGLITPSDEGHKRHR